MIIEASVDKEGNTGLRDVYFVCPACGSKYDTYEQTEECLVECALEEFGSIEEYCEEIEDDDR